MVGSQAHSFRPRFHPVSDLTADEDMGLYLSNEVKFYAAAMIQLRKVWSCPYFDSTDILGFCRIWFIQFIFLNIHFKPGFDKKAHSAILLTFN